MKHVEQFPGSEPRDFGTPERHKQSKVIQVALESERLPIAKAAIECRLDWYWDRMLIIDRQHEAGIRIRHMFRRAILPQATTSPYGAISGFGYGGSDEQADSRQKLFSALRGAGLATSYNDHPTQFRILTVGGEQRFPEKYPIRLLDLGHIVMAVCGLDEWAGGSGRLMSLRVGLTNLADYWHLER